MIEKEELYDVLLNGAGEVMFTIRVRDGEPKKPKIMYDGGEHALFYRTMPDMTQAVKESPVMILLDYLHEDVQERLNGQTEVMVMEIDYDSEEIMWAYKTPVVTVPKLPLPPGTEI